MEEINVREVTGDESWMCGLPSEFEVAFTIEGEGRTANAVMKAVYMECDPEGTLMVGELVAGEGVPDGFVDAGMIGFEVRTMDLVAGSVSFQAVPLVEAIAGDGAFDRYRVWFDRAWNARAARSMKGAGKC